MVAEVRGGKRVPPKRTQYRTTQTGYQFLRGSDIGNGRIKAEQLANIDKEIFETISSSVPKPTEVLLTVAGVVGKAALAGRLQNVAVTDNVSLIKPIDPNRLHPEFLMYLLLSSFMQFQIKKEMSELRQQKIGLDKLRSLRVPELPHLRIQEQALIRIRTEFEEAQQLKVFVATTKKEIDQILRAELGIASYADEDYVRLVEEDVALTDVEVDEGSESENELEAEDPDPVEVIGHP